MAKAIVTGSKDLREIARRAGGDPNGISFEPSINELDVPDIDQTSLNVVVANYGSISPSPEYKDESVRAIDAHCQEMINRGFEWPQGSGKIFSLSNNAQTKWLGLFVHFKLPTSKQLITFPFSVPTRDDKDSHTIQNLEEIEDIYSFISGLVSSYIAGALQAKVAINAATIISELETARDNYLST